MTEQTDAVTNELVDDFCYEIALALRRILNVGEETESDETTTED